MDTIFSLPKDIYKNRRLVAKLAKNDFKTRYAGSYLGMKVLPLPNARAWRNYYHSNKYIKIEEFFLFDFFWVFRNISCRIRGRINTMRRNCGRM